MGPRKRGRAAGHVEDGRRLAAVLSATGGAGTTIRWTRRRGAAPLGLATDLAHELGAALAERLADSLRPTLAALREEVAALRREVAGLRASLAGGGGRAAGPRGRGVSAAAVGGGAAGGPR